MAVSPHEDKMLGIQRQLQRNQQDVCDFISDLSSWEEEMKTKEQELLSKKKSDSPQVLPPVRNSLDQKKFKKKKKKKPEEEKKPKRISGFDFRAWDKFDVDKALEEVDGQEDNKSSSEYETDEEWELERKKHLANEEKNKGNAHVSAGAYEVAIECYTRGMDLDPSNALLPANRALALIKMERYGAAEVDCTTAITLDPLYVKAYLRRAAARVGLQRIAAALEDYQRVLQLEPGNKQAREEVERIKKEVQRDMDVSRPAETSLETTGNSEVKPIYKPPEQRSKKPLKRIHIEEIGLKDESERKAAISEVEAKQSKSKRETEAKDRMEFEKFTSKPSRDGDNENMIVGDTKVTCKLRHTAKTIDIQMSGDSKSKAEELSESKSRSDSMTLQPELTITSDSVTKEQSPQSQRSDTKPISHREGCESALVLERETPQSSFQFQADFKVLKNDLPSFYSYFKKIDPSLYPKLFGQSLEAPVLLKIVEATRHFSIPNNEDCYQQLKSLSEVKRFSMVTMFLTSKEKEGVREIFEYLKTKSSHPLSDIESLMKKYEV